MGPHRNVKASRWTMELQGSASPPSTKRCENMRKSKTGSAEGDDSMKQVTNSENQKHQEERRSRNAETEEQEIKTL